jgi:hypothetical protein
VSFRLGWLEYGRDDSAGSDGRGEDQRRAESVQELGGRTRAAVRGEDGRQGGEAENAGDLTDHGGNARGLALLVGFDGAEECRLDGSEQSRACETSEDEARGHGGEGDTR